MSKNPSTTKRVSVKKDGGVKAAKQNVDTIYLIQNQNEILKLKNAQIADKITQMKSQLIQCTSQLAKDQKQCERLRIQIKRSDLTDDIRLQTEKRALEQKIELLKGNCQILIRKIVQARQASVFEENKIPSIREQKKILERSLWENKTENQGTKIVLQNLQKELEKYRSENSVLVSKRKQYGPKQTQISNLIQQRLRIIKSRQKQSKSISKQQAAELIIYLINKLEFNRKKNTYIQFQRLGYLNKIMKKRIFLLSLIRRKYVLFVKNQVLQKFRQSFRPLKQLEQYQTILQSTHNRRVKNQIFRIWRKQSNKRQYLKIRYFQTQTILQKIAESYEKTVIFSTFNQIKYLRQNPLHKKAAVAIERISRAAEIRCKTMFFSRLYSLQNQFLKDLQLEQSAKQHSTLLVLSVYFTNWMKLAKENKTSNRYIKFRYFRQLKKLVFLKRKRQLSEMLTLTNEKIKQIDSMSVAFCHIKKQTTHGIIQSLGEQKKQIQTKNKDIQTKINNFRSEHKQNMETFGVLRLSSYLKKKVQNAFDIWRKFNVQTHKLKFVLNMLHGKMMNDVNLGFVMIQRRRFEKLKKSISDKIESCEFSYNYLVKQNAHIKEVLDNKLLQLEKSKFSNILRRLIRRQKETKHKYFYKFLKNGYKFWKFRRLVIRVDNLVEEKIKRVFIFLVKQINKQKKEELNLQSKINSMIVRRQNKLVSLVFGIFENIKIRNKKMKRIVGNLFYRNVQLNVYNGYNKIKKILTKGKEEQIEGVNYKIQIKVKQAGNYNTKIQQNIQILRQRLRNKEKSIKIRIVLAIRKLFIKNSTNKYLNYFNRWRNKLAYQKKVQTFVQIMQRKTRIILKNRLMSNLIKKKGDEQVGELKGRLQKFSNQLNEATKIYDNFIDQSQNKMKNMDKQNQFHVRQGQILQKRTDRMDDVKVASFRRYWGKIICKFVFRQWKIQKKQFVDQWIRLFKMLQTISNRQVFFVISSEMKNQILKNRLRKNLSYIYAKKFRNNAGLAFRIWRIVSLNARNKQSQNSYELQVSNRKTVADKYQKVIHAYQSSVNSRIGDRKMRKIFDFLKKYTRLKIDNNKKKLKLQTWLKRGYQIQFYRLFINKFKVQVYKKRKAEQFLLQSPKKKMRMIFFKIADIVAKKKIIRKLFLNKFIHYSLLKLYEQFFAKTKNYYRYVQITKKNHKTMCIQKVIQTFDKKRKDILCKNLRIWRKNQYQINIGNKLFKRLTRNAIYKRYEGMFYAWKLQSEAKGVLKYHHQQGQIKKRKVQIKRIEKFLHQFKKDKGLLLQNEEGNFVMSPRFQKKKQQEQKKDKKFRYKFISRLIMTINGYGSPIKAYNNLQMYMKLRQKYRKAGNFVLNHLRRPDVLLAFRTWKKAAANFRQDFQNMERKQLKKILNRQKDKMEMEYSNKLSVDQKIQKQLNRYKVFSYQRDKKQKLCAHVFLRNAKKVKGHAFQIWRKRASSLRDQQSLQLANRGQRSLEQLQQQIRQMRQIEQQLTLSSRRLREAVNEALQIAEMVRKISEQRDKLSHLIMDKNLTCESLIQENQVLNSKLHLAQKQAIRLLVISGERP